MKSKRLTALALSAAMILTNSGISFAAQNVGKPGEIKYWGQEVWITLNANGGEFLLKAAQTATPDNATSSTASKDEKVETSKTLDVGGGANNQDGRGLYLEFGHAQPAAKSAKENWNPMAKGPEKAPSEDGLEFDGWYTDKTFEDLSTKLTDDSKLYGHGDAYARWVNPNQATVKDEYAKEYVADVKVSGLKEDSKLVFAGLEEDKKKDVEEVTALLAETKFSGHVLSKDPSALVQLDISVDGKAEGPVGITMKDPFEGKYDYVLVLHMTDDGSKVRDNGIQSAVLDKEAATLSFTANGFSPYILAGVDSKMAKIKVENVKNGALVVWSEEPNKDGTRTYKVVPIGEEVEIPAGTELKVEEYGIDTEDRYFYLEDECYQVTSNGKTESFNIAEPYIVSDDAVISGEFIESTDDYDGIFSVTPSHLPSPGVYEGTVTGSITMEDGTKVPLTAVLDEVTDDRDWRKYDNELFTLEDGILKSKDKLTAGRYYLRLNGLSPEGEMLDYDIVVITVSNCRVQIKPNMIPESGIFEGTVEARIKVGGKWSDELMPVSFSDDNIYNNNDLFVLDGKVLKSKDVLKMGPYYLSLAVEMSSERIVEKRTQIHVGVGSYFYAPLAEYECSDGEETYTQYISCYFGDVFEKQGILFEDVEKKLYENEHIKEVAMYGDHKFKGWTDESGKIVAGSTKLMDSNDFKASFENYTPVKVGETTSPDKPDQPDNPDNPTTPTQPGRRPSGGSGGSSSGGGRAASSGGDTISGDWKKDEKGWWLQLKNGDYAKNQWGKINNAWYFFGADGYMLTGWQMINGQWYYLTETEANQGAMVTGWHYNEGYKAWFYLNADGAMLTGWQMINGKWYYLNPVSDGTQGSMAADTYIGEYYVNADGAWVE